MWLDECRTISLPRVSDSRGNLTIIEGGEDIPFEIQRVYYLSEVPPATSRGGHAHKALRQVFIAVAGSFDVLLDDGCAKKHFHLDQSDSGLYVGPMIWRFVDNFSPGAVCLVLASNHYDEADYYRDYHEYLLARGLK